ncbi:MAG: formylmethanofuran dehydrogenase subunit C [Planctomycetes bacterium]|nr:formylmethanofuran dehydrogenase subunit C [Planctomycetota bacterium]
MLILNYRASTTIPVEAECITPQNLAGKSPAEVASLPVQHGNTQVPLGEFFDIEGDASDGEVVLEGDCARVKMIGAGMSGGRLTVRGNVGMHLGAEMTGGEIHVHGSAGDWVGAEMRGGQIHVHGDAGHLVGATYRGGAVGMRGGVLLIDGKAGNEIGSGMRRGLIAIGGAVGDFPGVSMIAGSVFLFGPSGVRPGAGMKRGSLVFCADPPALLPTFRYDCAYRPVFLSLYLRQLKAWDFPVSDEVLRASWRRYSGDLVALGKGEILARIP